MFAVPKGGPSSTETPILVPQGEPTSNGSKANSEDQRTNGILRLWAQSWEGLGPLSGPPLGLVSRVIKHARGIVRRAGPLRSGRHGNLAPDPGLRSRGRTTNALL